MPALHHNITQSDELFVLTEVTKTLITPLDLSNLLDRVMDKLAEVLEPAEFGAVWLWDPSSAIFRPQAVCGPDFPNLQSLRQLALHKGESVAGKVYEEGHAIVYSTPDDLATAMSDLRPANRAAWAEALGSTRLPCSMVAIPLWAGGQKYGVLMLGSLHEHKIFTSEDLPFLQLVADLIALAIERAKLENAAQAARDTEQINRLRAEAMAALSHELRTPVGVIRGYCTALMLDEVAWSQEKQREFLECIDEECANLEALVGDVLDSSLMDVGQLTLEFQPVRLERLAAEVVNEIQYLAPDHQLTLDFPDDLPIIDADPYRIKQVLRNIIDNAVKYSPDGGRVHICAETQPGYIMISVADQGIGIAPEDLVLLFEKYYRTKNSADIHVSGTGLGLSIARAIVEAHRGRIWAESKIGKGSVFYFSLPQQQPG